MLQPLLPEPRRAERRPGSFRLRAGQPLVLAAGADDGDFATACALRDVVAACCGLRLAIECHGRSEDLGPRIELQRASERGEGYRLEIAPERVLLRGSGAAGLRYGAETLAQLAADAREGAPVGVRLDLGKAHVFPR